MVNTVELQKEILVYLPCYNCEAKIVSTLQSIPREFHDKIECLVVDNCSTDGTVAAVLKARQARAFPFPVHVVRNHENVGYAGSQKVGLSIAAQSATVRKIIILHGDGQYDPAMMREFLPYIDQDHAIVNGFRSKEAHPDKEETPWLTYVIIKSLSALESFVLGIPAREWHSGFVMYQNDFIRKIPLQRLSPYMHVDGEFLMCAGILNEKIRSVPIYKRYKGFHMFGGLARIKYIFYVFKLMARFKQGYYHRILSGGGPINVKTEYELLTA